MKISDVPFIPLTPEELLLHGEPHPLTTIRLSKGMSLRELASRINVAPSYLSALESCKKRNPSIRVCVALAKELRVPLTDIARCFGQEISDE